MESNGIAMVSTCYRLEPLWFRNATVQHPFRVRLPCSASSIAFLLPWPALRGHLDRLGRPGCVGRARSDPVLDQQLARKGGLLGAVAACGCLWWGIAKTAKAVFAIDSYRWSALWLGKLAILLMITAGLMKLVLWAQA